MHLQAYKPLLTSPAALPVQRCHLCAGATQLPALEGPNEMSQLGHSLHFAVNINIWLT